MNKAAFHWGRRAAVDPAALEVLIKPAPEATSDARRLSQSFDEMVERRVAFLTAYQDAEYARPPPGEKARQSRGGRARQERTRRRGRALSIQAMAKDSTIGELYETMPSSSRCKLSAARGALLRILAATGTQGQRSRASLRSRLAPGFPVFKLLAKLKLYKHGVRHSAIRLSWGSGHWCGITRLFSTRWGSSARNHRRRRPCRRPGGSAASARQAAPGRQVDGRRLSVSSALARRRCSRRRVANCKRPGAGPALWADNSLRAKRRWALDL